MKQKTENQAQSKTHDGPLVSVIIPTYNRPKFLKDAINSVLGQSIQNFEIIVINDGGNDVSQIIDALNTNNNIHLITHPHRKDVAAARNTGLKSAKGLYIAYLDDDDIYYPDHLDTLVSALENTNFPVIYTDSFQVVMRWITDQYVPVEKKVLYSQDFDREKLLVSNYIPTLNIGHRKDLINKIGYFDESLEVHEDWDFWIRASIQHDFLHINKTTAEFRTTIGGQHTKSKKKITFLNTIKQIHKRYAHLVSSPDTMAAQQRASKALSIEGKDQEKTLIIENYHRQHFYHFAGYFADNNKVLDLNCDDGSSVYLLSATAQSIVASGNDHLKINQAGAQYIGENLTFIYDFMNTPEARATAAFHLITCYDALTVFQNSGLDSIGKTKELLTPDGIFVLSVSGQKSSDLSQDIEQGLEKKISFHELRTHLEKEFNNVFFWRQKLYPASAIIPCANEYSKSSEYLINNETEHADKGEFFKNHPDELIVVATDANGVIHPARSFMVDTEASLFNFWETCISLLESANIEQQAHIRTLGNEIKNNRQHSQNIESLLADQKRHADNLKNELTDRQHHIRNLENELKTANDAITSAHQALNEKQSHIHELQETVARKESHTQKLSATIEQHHSHIHSLENKINDMIADITEKNLSLTELWVIRQSLAWRVVEGIRRRINRLFPESSRRRTIYLKMVSASKIYLNDGFLAVLKKTMRKVRSRRHGHPQEQAIHQSEETPASKPLLMKQKQETLCPVHKKRIDEPSWHIEHSERAIVKNKISAIKQELLEEFRQVS